MSTRLSRTRGGRHLKGEGPDHSRGFVAARLAVIDTATAEFGGADPLTETGPFTSCRATESAASLAMAVGARRALGSGASTQRCDSKQRDLFETDIVTLRSVYSDPLEPEPDDTQRAAACALGSGQSDTPLALAMWGGVLGTMLQRRRARCCVRA